MTNEHHHDPANLMAAIVASSRVRAKAMGRSQLAELERLAADCHPRRAEFVACLSRKDKVNIVAECKRRSPLKGILNADLDASEVAQAYHLAGAAAISVLTEPHFFGGSLDDLRAVRAHVPTPLLRKDFIVDERQIVEARAAGADAVLLIVAALDAEGLRRLMKEAWSHGLACLVEVHSEAELDRALECDANVIGVNTRDLRTMKVHMDTLDRLAPKFPKGIVRVAESGIKSRADINRLRAIGYQAFLVGERLVTSDNPGQALAQLVGSIPACS